jgi:hypothetical protein
MANFSKFINLVIPKKRVPLPEFTNQQPVKD